MKKLRSVLILTLLLCLLPMCTALAKTGKITASSLNMRKGASTDSKVVGVLREGDKVTIKDSSGSWYKVTKGSKTGYVAKKYVKVTNGSDNGSSSSGSSKKSSKSSGSSDGTCGPGDTGSAVKKVQQRLKRPDSQRHGKQKDAGETEFLQRQESQGLRRGRRKRERRRVHGTTELVQRRQQ